MKIFFKAFFVSFFLCSIIYAQQSYNYAGRHFVTRQHDGTLQRGYITTPEINHSLQVPFTGGTSNTNNVLNGTTVRWNYTDAVSIGDHCAVSGNGDYSAVAWDLNNARISLYNNTNSTPIWEYTVTNNFQVDFVSLNYAGDLIAAGAAQNVYVFTNSSNVPILNIDLTTLGGSPTAGPVALAQNEDFLVATSDLTDSSIILGFNTSSTVPVWSATLIDPTGISGNILGVRLSGNDSLMIVNTYGYFWVMKTFTGDIIYQDYINPLSNTSGTQAFQGINYDGSVIATVNYFGYVRVFQWDGSTYNLLWQDQEPPGTYYNWANSVAVSADGEYVAVGTLIFVTSSSYNGTVKLYKTSQGPPAEWIYDNCGDNVTAVSFNGPGNVLAASSWGALDNSTPDLYVFKTWEGSEPIFTVTTGGSFFDEAISYEGGTVFTTGKAVHARTFGSGGLAYNVNVDTSDTNVPVELTSFTASVNDGNVTLNWSTATETNNRGFEVERKSNDGQYSTIAFLEGHGTTTQEHQYSYVDKKVTGGNYTYRLKQTDFNGSFQYSKDVEVHVKTPTEYSLQQNYPNPFNPSTKIDFSLASDSKVTLKVYDVLGRQVAELLNSNLTAGEHTASFNAVNLTSGVYFYKLEAKGVNGNRFTSIKKMILMK
jgi:Secretion system C-terminal sorting domain